MTDIIGRIYSGTGATWAETVDYEILDVIDYQLIDNSGYSLDQAEIIVYDENKKYADNLDADISGTTQVWRAYGKWDGKLIMSGILKEIEEDGKKTFLRGQNMSTLFTRRVVQDYSITGDGSLKWTDILTHATSGLLQGSGSGLLPAAEYKAFDLTTHVVASSNTIPTGQIVKYDNMTLFEVVADVCQRALGASDRNYDCYLFEMDDDDETLTPDLSTAADKYKMCLYLKEKGSTAPVVTLTGNMIDRKQSRWSKIKNADTYHNKVSLRGGFEEVNKTPIGGDWWTEQASTAAYQTFWTVINGAQSDVQRDTDVGDFVEGSSSVRLEFDKDDTVPKIVLDLSDADAYDSALTPDLVDGVGYPLDDEKDLWLTFKYKADETTATGHSIGLEFYTDAGHNFIVRTTGVDPDSYYLNEAGGYTIDEWRRVDIPLKSVISSEDWSHIKYLSFFADGVVGSNTVMNVDRLQIYRKNYQVTGSATQSGVTTYLNEIPLNDPNIDNDTQAVLIAQQVLKELEELRNKGVFPVLGPYRSSDWRTGNTVEANIPGLNLYVIAGETVPKFEIEKIIYVPNRKILHVGRYRSITEIFQSAKTRIQQSYIRLRG